MYNNILWYLNLFVFKKNISIVFLTVFIGFCAAILLSLGMGLLIPVISELISVSNENDFFHKTSHSLLNFFNLNNNIIIGVLFASLIIFIGETLAFISSILGALLNKNALKENRNLLIKQILFQSYLEIIKYKGGKLNSIINEQVSLASEIVEVFFRLLVQLLIAAALVATLSIISLNLTLVSLFVGLFILISQHKIYQLFRNSWGKWQHYKVSSTGYYADLINSIKFIKQSGLENLKVQEIENKTLKESNIIFKGWVFKYLSPYYTKSMATWIVACLILIGLFLFKNTGAEILIFLVVIRKIQASVNQINLAFIDLNKLEPSIKIIRQFTNSYQKIDMQNSNNNFIFNNKINFRSIKFNYQNKIIINDLNIEILKNSFVSIVGISGSGKSTLVNLLTRLISPNNGVIEIDNIDIKSIKSEQFYSNVAVVSQDDFLFHDSISTNITYGQKFDYTKLVESCTKSFCLDFIHLLEDKFETVVGDRGIILSGGQIQRILLARALYKEPKILILDEATSSVDGVIDKKISESFSILKKNMTIINIAHRPSAVIHSDCIYYLNAGKILHKGTHEKLLNISNNYANLFKVKNDRE